MSQTIKETVTVTSLSKWGPKVGNEYYSWSKNIKEADKGRVVPGGTFVMELYVADSGKKYINSVANLIEGSYNSNLPDIRKVPLIAPVFKDIPLAKSFTAKVLKEKSSVSEGMSKDEWAAKDRRISRQGVIQVAVQITSNFKEACDLADKMLSYVCQDPNLDSFRK